jgi:hypothetical protein
MKNIGLTDQGIEFCTNFSTHSRLLDEYIRLSETPEVKNFLRIRKELDACKRRATELIKDGEKTFGIRREDES